MVGDMTDHPDIPLDRADWWDQRWQAAPRDNLSDCVGCDPSTVADYLNARGRRTELRDRGEITVAGPAPETAARARVPAARFDARLLRHRVSALSFGHFAAEAAETTRRVAERFEAGPPEPGAVVARWMTDAVTELTAAVEHSRGVAAEEEVDRVEHALGEALPRADKGEKR
jgi:hypothetical protein